MIVLTGRGSGLTEVHLDQGETHIFRLIIGGSRVTILILIKRFMTVNNCTVSLESSAN